MSNDRIREIIEQFKGKRGATIPVLQAVQEECGYLPKEAFKDIEEILGIPTSKAYGVAKFYAQFRMTPHGKHVIKVCDGTACHVRGSETLLDFLKGELGLEGEKDTTDDMVFTLEEVACLGCCSLAPVLMIDDSTHGNLTLDMTKEILAKYKGASE